MTAPTTQVVQMTFHNPGATMSLYVPVAVICNTSDADLERNVRENTRRILPWLPEMAKPHDGVAIMCGGGASIGGYLDVITGLVAKGGNVFAMNAASRYLRERGIGVDFQVIADAKAETAQLVDPGAREHLFASQVNWATIDAAPRAPILWHLQIGDIEQYFPRDRVDAGGYCLIGGGAAVGNAAMVVAYAMGYRAFHVFGYDSCHQDGRSHAYPQPMNRFVPTVEVEWAGRKFLASVNMKDQAAKFQMTGQSLKQQGCFIQVYGDGLLQTMWNAPPQSLTERDKYRTLWQFGTYRDWSPGEDAVEMFLAVAKPNGLIVDFGCGTGRAALKLADLGHDVMLVDFADNCRDEEALKLPFLEWDLTRPCPVSAPYGFCVDVMEHIPTDDVDAVIWNIMTSANAVFFQISTREDDYGAVVGQKLHNTVRPHEWWADRFADFGFVIEYELEVPTVSQFYVRNPSDGAH